MTLEQAYLDIALNTIDPQKSAKIKKEIASLQAKAQHLRYLLAEARLELYRLTPDVKEIDIRKQDEVERREHIPALEKLVAELGERYGH